MGCTGCWPWYEFWQSFLLTIANLLSGLAKAQYAIGYFTEMGIGCHRDPLEANVWYVKAADQGDERAKHRIAAIRAAADGGNPAFVARNGGRVKKDGKGPGECLY